MEDGVKEETPEKPKRPPTVEKMGWIKKSSGGILSLWKERYIQLCKTQLLVYEDEDEQKCVETVELERYDRCQDLRALLKRKNRFILIRAPGCKVQDIKFQASNAEEKESWMKALNDGISRGKNKIFDEVKVDESLSLEHVTRGRAKLAQGRRPPTRSHLKEVASAVSDGILRLDLDVPDNGPPSTSLETSEVDDVPLPKEKPKPPMPPAKVPMPPSDKLSADSTPEDVEVKKPPMPPAKPLKETAAPSEDTNSVEKDVAAAGNEDEEPKVALDGEDVTEASENSRKVPVPPPKILSDKMKVTWDSPASEQQCVEAENPSPDGSKENLSEVAKEMLKPPAPPPKILSEQLKASMYSNRSSLKVEASEGDCQPDDSNLPVNGIAGEETAEPVFRDEGEQGEASAEQGANQESLGLLSKDQPPSLDPEGKPRAAKPRCASLGDLLSRPAKEPLPGPDLQQRSAFQVAKMERKVACEQERTEKLLQKVLQGGCEQAQEDSNGPPISAEILLNEAAKQLQQATQVLQEIRDLGELKKQPAERRKGAPKDLATLYRRSAP
ncbi:pleckstrin homology domain-containing family O member 2 [Rhineura floridana]|uniref:pleckstrin homology domain-containing family O member 2 n=1 Tax=Rhineura floridana TaxID=261503 RepID=UPI002AC8418E|nr:pleckstrin homology domain-containing family O member 2 [Rhineura floridana]